MTLRNAAGNILSKAELTALTTALPTPPADRVLSANVYETYSLSGEGSHQMGRRLKFRAGQVLKQSEIDAMYVPGAVTSITPATGPANTTISIKGTNLSGVETVTAGGVACTQVKVVSDTEVTARVGAHAAGAVSVVVGDDYADITVPNGFTYS